MKQAQICLFYTRARVSFDRATSRARGSRVTFSCGEMFVVFHIKIYADARCCSSPSICRAASTRKLSTRFFSAAKHASSRVLNSDFRELN